MRVQSLAVADPRGTPEVLSVRSFEGDAPLGPVLQHAFAIEGCPLGQQPRAGSEDLCKVCAADSCSDSGEGAACVACPEAGADCTAGVPTLRRG